MNEMDSIKFPQQEEEKNVKGTLFLESLDVRITTGHVFFY